MALVLANNASTTLASGINDSATSITVSSATGFPSISGSQFFYVTLDDATNVEIVKVTGVSGTTFTVVRAQDDTSAAAFSTGAAVAMRITKLVLKDNITTTLGALAGQTIADSGDLTLDVAGDIILDADGDNIYLKAGGGNQASFSFINSDVYLGVETQDKDLIIRGNDGGSTITALTLDMSEAGKATFNDMVVAPKADIDSADIRQLTTEFIHGDSAVFDSATITTLAVGTLNIDNINIGDSATFTNVAVSTALNTNSLIVDDITIDGSTITDAGTITIDANAIDLDADGGNITLKDGGTEIGQFQLNDTNHLKLVSKVSDADIFLQGNDGGSTITALRLDMSEAGKATFNAGAGFTGDITQASGDYLYTGGGNFDIKHSTDDQNIVFSTSTGGSTTEKMRIRGASNSVAISGTLSVGNLNVDSADIIKIARDNLSTANSSALTYDSAGGQFGLNANHVMALIQTVDSNGSGLNADTLEGQAGSHYRINVYNASGTLLN